MLPLQANHQSKPNEPLNMNYRNKKPQPDPQRVDLFFFLQVHFMRKQILHGIVILNTNYILKNVLGKPSEAVN
jgi:hypothetical protein